MRRTDKNKEKIKHLEDENNKKIKRAKNIKIFKVVTVIFLLFSFAYVSLRYIGTSGLIIREYSYKSNKITENFYGSKIVHFSDLHYGHTTDMKKVEDLVNKINYIKPDIVVFTGDLVDNKISDDDLKKLSLNLAKISASLGKYMVLGNHDRDSKISKALTDASFIDLNNKFDLIYKDSNDAILISGIGDVILKRDDIQSAMAYFLDEASKRDIFSLVITHEGDILDELIGNYPVDLALSGHSHNGQVRLPKIGSIIKVRGAKKYSEESYDVNGTKIYVSGGIGTTVFPFRFFNNPSINLIRIK